MALGAQAPTRLLFDLADVEQQHVQDMQLAQCPALELRSNLSDGLGFAAGAYMLSSDETGFGKGAEAADRLTEREQVRVADRREVWICPDKGEPR
jgi:hypothetical protein